jgi:phosphoribosylamine-glycine ligase
MYIYNVTVNVEESIHEAWLSWMKNKHIQEVLNTQKFQSARLVKVLVEEDMGGTTYSVQYFTDSKEKLDAYYLEDAPRLREEGMRLFGDKMLAFRTELEVLEEF